MHAHDSNGIPEGGTPLSDEIARYNAYGHWYLTTLTRTWHKGITRILKNEPMDDGLLRWIASHGSYDQYKKALGEAADRGKLAHELVPDLINGETLETPHFLNVGLIGGCHKGASSP